MTYRRRASPLHAARASVACLWCAALALAALISWHPLVLTAVLVTAPAAALAAGVGREVGRFTLLIGLPIAVLFTVVNPLISREGLTVVARLGGVWPIPEFDVTAESIAYGAVTGLRAMAIIACCALYFSAVDPDRVLRLFRRFGFRSALTATLATRLVGVLAADARRLSDGQRCRPGAPASRLAIVRAVTAGALDRAGDVAAALEVRGYGGAAAPARARVPWSRHDVAFALSAAAIAALAIGAQAGGLAGFDAYPRVELQGGSGAAAIAAALAVAGLLPFLDRRGIAR
jgi:energy-coupling factor transport system permease protein